MWLECHYTHTATLRALSRLALTHPFLPVPPRYPLPLLLPPMPLPPWCSLTPTTTLVTSPSSYTPPLITPHLPPLFFLPGTTYSLSSPLHPFSHFTSSLIPHNNSCLFTLSPLLSHPSLHCHSLSYTLTTRHWKTRRKGEKNYLRKWQERERGVHRNTKNWKVKRMGKIKVGRKRGTEWSYYTTE